MNIIVALLTLLIAAVNAQTVATCCECEDATTFDINGTDVTCAQAVGGLAVYNLTCATAPEPNGPTIRANCPLTCGSCTVCADATSFDMGANTVTCNQAVTQLTNSGSNCYNPQAATVLGNCSISCDACNPPPPSCCSCEDATTIYLNGTDVTCAQAVGGLTVYNLTCATAPDPNGPMILAMCPLTCGSCSVCADASSFTFNTNTVTCTAAVTQLTNAGMQCTASNAGVVLDNCPLSCDACGTTTTCCDCEDTVGTFNVSGNDVTCAQAVGGLSANSFDCNSAPEPNGGTIRDNCPLACGLCSACADATNFTFNANTVTCNQAVGSLTTNSMTCDSTGAEVVLENCPVACDICTPATAEPTATPDPSDACDCDCEDEDSVTLNGNTLTCQVAMASIAAMTYTCATLPGGNDAVALAACPASCGVCTSCADATSFSFAGQTVDCPSALAALANNQLTCDSPQAAIVKENCPTSCGECDVVVTSEPTSTPAACCSCEDDETVTVNGNVVSCPTGVGHLTGFGLTCATAPDPTGPILRAACPLSCGNCTACADATSFSFSGQTVDCPSAMGALATNQLTCNDAQAATVKDNCPISCNACNIFTDEPTVVGTSEPTVTANCCNCVDQSSVSMGGNTVDCATAYSSIQAQSLTCTTTGSDDNNAALTANCPLTCGLCTECTDPVTECATDEPTMAWGMVVEDSSSSQGQGLAIGATVFTVVGVVGFLIICGAGQFLTPVNTLNKQDMAAVNELTSKNNLA